MLDDLAVLEPKDVDDRTAALAGLAHRVDMQVTLQADGSTTVQTRDIPVTLRGQVTVSASRLVDRVRLAPREALGSSHLGGTSCGPVRLRFRQQLGRLGRRERQQRAGRRGALALALSLVPVQAHDELVVESVEPKTAIAAGAEHVGFEDLIKKVQEGFTDFDSAIATPDAMTEVRKIARVLGPRGLMPNPKTGTVTDDTAKAVKEVKAGRIDFKLDKNGNVSGSIGKVSFDPEHLAENARSFVDGVVRAKPASAKGNYIQAVTLAATMLPGIPLEAATYTKASA